MDIRGGEGGGDGEMAGKKGRTLQVGGQHQGERVDAVCMDAP